jgi:hypothetical protein
MIEAFDNKADTYAKAPCNISSQKTVAYHCGVVQKSISSFSLFSFQQFRFKTINSGSLSFNKLRLVLV